MYKLWCVISPGIGSQLSAGRTSELQLARPWLLRSHGLANSLFILYFTLKSQFVSSQLCSLTLQMLNFFYNNITPSSFT